PRKGDLPRDDEAERRDRQLGEKGLEERRDELRARRGGQRVEPRVADEERPGHRRGELQPRPPPVEAEGGRADRYGDRNVEAGPGGVPVLDDVLRRERRLEDQRPRQPRD